jgi:hypothetical protein
MNMFRDLLILVLIGLGVGLMLGGDPNDWKWVDACGPYVVTAMTFLYTAKPFSYVICFALSLALFLTRLKY